MASLRFNFLTGDTNWKEYGGKFISKRLSNGEFDYWLILDVINMHEATGDESADKYVISIQAVSPSQAGESGLNDALSCLGLSDDDMTLYESDPIRQCEALAEYGIMAHLWQTSGNNIVRLMCAAHAEASKIIMLFGFYMDKPENRLGQNGWNLISGQTMSAFFAARTE